MEERELRNRAKPRRRGPQWRIYKDLAIEVREYFIPDFSNWKDHDSFEAGFKRLLKDLREAEAL